MSELEVKTSETSPIRVDFVAGRPLGLTFAPGKRGPSQLGTYTWDRDLRIDLQRLVEHYGVSCLVTLLEEHELEFLGISGLREAVRAEGMTSHWFPIVDGGVPGEVGGFIATVRTIRSALRTGERVVVHCRGGLGRAGTVAACVLIAQGEEPTRAMELVRAARAKAIENAAQETFVERFAMLWNNTSHGPP